MRSALPIPLLAFTVMGLSILGAHAEPFQSPRTNGKKKTPDEIYSQSLQDIQMDVLNEAASKLDKTVNNKSKADPLLGTYMVVSLEGEGYQVRHPNTRQDLTSLVLGGVSTVPGLEGALLPGEFKQWADIASTKTKHLLRTSLPPSEEVVGAVVSTDGLVIPISIAGRIKYDKTLTINHPEVSPIPSVLDVVKNLREGRTSEPPVGDNSSYVQLRQLVDEIENPKPLVKLRKPVLSNTEQGSEPAGKIYELNIAPLKIKVRSDDE